MTDEDAAELQEMRSRRVDLVRGLAFHRQPYAAEDMLMSLKPNEAGYFASHPYDGGPFDAKQFRLVKGGWNHDHCFICGATVNPGDVWLAAEPPGEVGLCLVCHGEYMEARAAQGSREAYDRVLARVPAAPPLPGDGRE